jgi:O-antigen ligase
MIGPALFWMTAGLSALGLLFAWSPNALWWGGFQLSIFAITIVWILGWILGLTRIKWHWTIGALAVIPIWGTLQLLLGWTAYPHATAVETLRWLVYWCVFSIAFEGVRVHGLSRSLRKAFLVFGTLLSLYCFAQYYFLDRKIYGKFVPTEAFSGYGPFLNPDHFGLFVCIVMCCVGARLKHKDGRWLYALLTTLLLAGVVSTGSRAATLIAILAAMLLMIRAGLGGKGAALLTTLSVAFVGILGWESLSTKLTTGSSYADRGQVSLATVSMWLQHPLSGNGLGTWTILYPSFSRHDFGVFVNAAHNDWLQWASDGGIVMLAGITALFIATCLRARRSIWVLAAIVPFIHSLIDFPLQGHFLSAIVFFLMGVANAE